jgi:cupin superfamily acireductone dioxygenase involved in methionine salvage
VKDLHKSKRPPSQGATMSRYSTDLFKELQSIQNDPKFQNVDIISITAMMNNEQFKQHVETHRQLLQEV